MTRYMVVEYFTDPRAVYARLAVGGRNIPPGVRFIDSWVDAEHLDRCFQLMDADSIEALEQWMASWSDLGRFEVVPVISSAEASDRVLGDSEPSATLDDDAV